MPAISSMLASRLTTASSLARSLAPTAIVTDRTAGMATGTAATVSTSANCKVVSMLSPRNRAVARIRITRLNASTIR